MDLDPRSYAGFLARELAIGDAVSRTLGKGRVEVMDGLLDRGGLQVFARTRIEG